MIELFAYLVIVTSTDPSVAETSTAVRCGSMSECLGAANALKLLHPHGRRPATVVVRSHVEERPSFWVE